MKPKGEHQCQDTNTTKSRCTISARDIRTRARVGTPGTKTTRRVAAGASTGRAAATRVTSAAPTTTIARPARAAGGAVAEVAAAMAAATSKAADRGLYPGLEILENGPCALCISAVNYLILAVS